MKYFAWSKYTLDAWGKITPVSVMEQFIDDIKAYANAVGRSPQHILRQAVGASWLQWTAWVNGQSSPTLNTVDKIHKYMVNNPAPARAVEDVV